MPQAAIPWLIGASIGGNVAGAVIGKKASSSAAKVQSDAEAQSLALQKQMYGDAQARYQPYQDLGTSVMPTLRSLAGNVQAPAYGTNLRNLSIYGQQPPAMPQSQPMASAAPSAPMGGSGGLVTMQAPDGSTQAVRPELVQHYVQRGAKVVNGGMQ